MTRRLLCALFAAILVLCPLLLTGCDEEKAPAPLSLSASSTERTISVRWDAAEGADRFRLFKKNTADGKDFRFVCDVTDGFSYTDEYVEKEKEYVYKIKAFAGASVIAEGICAPVRLGPSPEITIIRQIKSLTYEAQWDKLDTECVLYGKTSSEWREIGRSKDGFLRFENTNNYSEIAVSTTAADAILSSSVTLGTPGSVFAVTALDDWTNVVELGISEGDWKYEIARSETSNGVFTTVGSAENDVFYDVKEEDDTKTYWYRLRCLGDRFESAWSEPVRLGTNQREIYYLPVIVYHELLPENERAQKDLHDEDVITPEDFQNDLIWLKEHGYTSISAAELIAFLEGEAELPEKPILLTFDDGKYSVYEWAWPILTKHGMKATLAVIGSQIDSATKAPQERENADAAFCTWDELAEMSASGAIEIISHTQNMPAFSRDGRQGANVAEGETASQYAPLASADAKQILGKIEEATGAAIPAMAYPYSIRSEESDRAWIAAGYKLLLCGNSGSVHTSKWNPMIREAGLNLYSTKLRRFTRLEDTSVEWFLQSFENMLVRNGEE
jgi:peptidoglycan/xylan/chitin deacetylase (PgdA/CDA1 family)